MSSDQDELDMVAPISVRLHSMQRGQSIRAKVFPVIEPQSNSFVFELRSDATIFLYLDPQQSPAKFAAIR